MAFAGIFSIAGVDVKSDLTSLRGSQRVGGVAARSPPKSPELGMALFNVNGAAGSLGGPCRVVFKLR